MFYKYLILCLALSLTFSLASFAQSVTHLDYDNVKDTMTEMKLKKVKETKSFETDDKEYNLSLRAKSIDGKTYILTNYNTETVIYQGHTVEAFDSLLISND